MTVTTKSKSDLVAGQVAAIQALVAGYVDFSVGSILLAEAEATSDVALWLQGLILYLLATTRAQTSQGVDLDTWMAQFGFIRQTATAATVAQTFSRISTTGSAVVLVGATVQTADGAQTFTVTTDTTNSAYNANAGGAGVAGYAMTAGVGSVTVPVLALTAGASGNVTAGALRVITSSIPGVDRATNASAATGGADSEGDATFRARFVAYLSSLSRGTPAAIRYAISLAQNGLSTQLTENMNYAGSVVPGNFYTVVDDGSGSPSSPLLALIGREIDAYRPIGSTFQVYGPNVVTANVSLTLTVTAGADHTIVSGIVSAALTAFVNAIEFGGSLPYTRLLSIIYDADSRVANVSGLLLNSGTSDLSADAKSVIRIGTVSIA